ncbi:MAG: peptide-methionine (S)-S-oxide reductase MsrA [Candidatus Acidiferrales bacterium]
MEKATFAAGCFWGVEAAFREMPGVASVISGYTGGHLPNPTYKLVCSHTTGHAEAVEIEFDSQQVSYEQLVEKFWSLHNPTTLNRQGPDVGTQYRSAIFFHSPAQEAAAIASRDRLQNSGKLGDRKIVTEIVPAKEFWRAEEYHQRYFEKNGISQCHF